MDKGELAEAVRDACLQAARAAYEQAGVSGLCAEGRWECAVQAIKGLQLDRLTVAAARGDTAARASSPHLAPGENIAVKVPDHQYRAMVGFYRDLVGLKVLEEDDDSVMFDFAGKRLWVDRMDQLSQAEIWLELTCDDLRAAADHLAGQGVARRDRIEALPEGLRAFWISAPGGIIHLISEQQGADDGAAAEG